MARYVSSDGLMSSSDPAAVELWESIGARMANDEATWTEILRVRGVKLAHPDDGWVKRDRNRFHLSWYPQFDDHPEIGDLIAFGKPPSGDHYRSWHDVWRGRRDQYAREQMKRLDGQPESSADGYRICRVVNVNRTQTILAHGLNTEVEYEDTGERMPARATSMIGRLLSKFRTPPGTTAVGDPE